MIRPTLLPLRHAALRSGVSPERLLRAIVRRELVGQPVGARWYVDAADLDRYESQRATQPASPGSAR